MTPWHLREIFERRGAGDAREIAAACREPYLKSLVERWEWEKKKKNSEKGPMRPGKTARDRASGAVARLGANRRERAEKNRQRALRAGNKGKKAS